MNKVQTIEFHWNGSESSWEELLKDKFIVHVEAVRCPDDLVCWHRVVQYKERDVC